MEPAGLVERLLRGAEEPGQREDDRAADDRPVRDRIGSLGDLVDRRLAADAARRRRDEVSFRDLGSSNVFDSRTRIVSSGWLRCADRRGGRGDHLLAVEEPSGEQEPDGELRLVAGRPHRDRDRDRILTWPRRADLERRLADHPVVAHLERVAADRDDPTAGDVPDGRRSVAGSGRTRRRPPGPDRMSSGRRPPSRRHRRPAERAEPANPPPVWPRR